MHPLSISIPLLQHAHVCDVVSCFSFLYWYIPLLQEVIIPMVMDARMPEDVLFVLLEEDFRFWPHGEDPDSADDYKARLGEVLKNKREDEPLSEQH